MGIMMIAGTERRRQGCSLQAFKQWGFEETETKTIAFPISFESIKYVFLSKIYGPASGGADTVAYNFFRKSLTGVSFDYAYTRNWLAIGGQQPQWGYYTAAVGAIYTDVTTPVSFSRCFLAASIDILLAASTTWPGTTQTVWNINASTANKLRFIWAKAPIELDGAVWFGIFIQTVGIYQAPYHHILSNRL